MSSKSSNNVSAPPLPVGTVTGFRGQAGEFTVRVASGDAGRWLHLTTVLIGTGPDGSPESHCLQSCRGYRDRLVLKLECIDTPSEAESLRGLVVYAPADQVPVLREGRYYLSRLIGLEARDESGRAVGVVGDVLEAGGTETLAVRDGKGNEILVPLAAEYVREVDETAGYLVLGRIEELAELNRPQGGEDGF